MHNKVHKVHGTNRQSVTAADGTAMQRAYIYLPSHVWHLLQEAARANGTSVSQTIQSFAISGNANSKDQPNVKSPIRAN
jgi:hypothetical protein